MLHANRRINSLLFEIVGGDKQFAKKLLSRALIDRLLIALLRLVLRYHPVLLVNEVMR